MTGTDGAVTSRSALATLTAPASTFATDPLLSLVANHAPRYQLEVIVLAKETKSEAGGAGVGGKGGKASKKGGGKGGKGKGKVGTEGGVSDPQPASSEGGAGGLTLVCGPDALTHRNAILRVLCGAGLHGALDALFLGGHHGASLAGASPASSLALAGISSWMSVASSVRDKKGSDGDAAASALVGELNSYLASRTFLVPGARATLADLDVYLALASALESSDGLEKAVGKELGNVRRWCDACRAILEDLSTRGASSSDVMKEWGRKELEVRLPRGLAPRARPLPIFFYGDEDADVVAAAAAATAAASGSSRPAGVNGAEAASASEKVGGEKSGGGGGDLTDEQKKAATDKRAKKAAEKAAKKNVEPKQKHGGKGGGGDAAAELNVSALDIRVGKIVKAWEHEGSEKLYCEEVDVGEESGPRKIASGLRPFYKLDEMQNRTVLVLCNLKARNLVGFPSHGMVLCASNSDHTEVVFAIPPEGAKIGERIAFEGFDGEPEAENKLAKKKMFEKLAPDLKTDGSGEVVWKGIKASTSAGPCRAMNSMANAQVS